MGIIAHVDHGKCVSEDTLVPLSSGEIAPIADLYQRFQSGDELAREVDSFDVSALAVKDRMASHVFKLNADTLVEVILDNGWTVRTTPEHPFYALSRHGLVESVRAERLKAGEYLLVPLVLKPRIASLERVKEQILAKLAAKPYYLAYLGKRHARALRSRVEALGSRKVYERASCSCSFVAFRANLETGRFRLNDLASLANTLGISWSSLYDQIERLNYRLSVRRFGKHSRRIYLPKYLAQFRRLAYLVGLLYGDGSVRASLHNSDPRLLSSAQAILKGVLDVQSKLILDKRTLGRRLDHHGGMTLIKFLEDLCDYPPYHKSHRLKLPWLFLIMNDSVLASFLRGLYDTDGYVEKNSRCVGLTTASTELAKRVSIALLRFGIQSRLSRKGKYLTVKISSRSCIKFLQRIGFSKKDKRTALRKIARRSLVDMKTGFLPIAPDILRDLRTHLAFPRTALGLPFYSNLESGRTRISRENLAAIARSLRSFTKRRIMQRLIVTRLIGDGFTPGRVAKEIGLPVAPLNGIVEQLIQDGVIRRTGRRFTVTKYGLELMRDWSTLLKSRQARQNLRDLLSRWLMLSRGEAGFVKVKSCISATGNFDVYDISVPMTHTFIGNGIVVHNTTMSDSLLAAAGLLSPSMAGTALALDYMEEEQKRQMTIKAANISLLHERNGTAYVINLIDTPGHVDFSGRVTRSLRAIDGAVVVVDSVEEIMVQTETVTRQALEERVRPVLYINKIDRLIKELRLTPDQIQERIGRIITEFNRLVDLYAEPEYRERWKVNFATNTVAMGSAKDRWGFTAEIAEKKGVRFSDVAEAYAKDMLSELVQRAPLHEAILNMAVESMPAPHVAQKYRIPRVWKGDISSEIGQAMLNCDDNGPIVMAVTNIVVDPQAGVVASGRLFSGTISEGMTLHLLGARVDQRVQQVCIFMGPYREIVGTINAGNIPALLGLDAAKAGETLSIVKDIAPFEAVRYVTEPVVTMAVEPKFSRDLPKLVDILRKLNLEDPNLVTKINEETGEYLIAGMGTLHLEIATTLITKTGLEIVTSTPIVIYREGIRDTAGPVEGRSPNKHNKIYIQIEPLPEKIIKMIHEGKIGEYQDRHEMAKILREEGWSPDEARGVWSVDEGGNMLVEVTKGAQFLQEVKDMVVAGYRWGLKEGPLAYEQIRGLKAKITDISLHEDPVHRGPAQIMPMARRAFFAGFLSADPILMEPVQKITVKVPPELLGVATSVISQKRGKIISVEQRGHLVYVTGELPTAETFDLSEVMRSASQGRAFWGLEFSHWAPVPQSMVMQVIADIRKRKGLPPEPHKAEDFME